MLSKYLKSDFLKNVAILISSSGISQLIPFLVLPFLQKYFYSPKDFGVLSIYLSFSVLIIKFSTFSYELAIVKQNNEKDALSILIGTLEILFISTIIITLSLLTLYFFFPNNFYIENLHSFIFLIPISVFSFGAYQTLRYWFNWKKQFKKIGQSMIVKTGMAESGKVILGELGNAFGLVIGRVLGELSSFLFLAISFIKYDFSKVKTLQQKHIIGLLKQNYKFPVYSLPSNLKGFIINIIFINSFTYYFGLEKVGLIGISLSYLGAGLGIISQSFSQVFYKKIFEVSNQNLSATLKKNVLLLLSISLTFFTAIQIIPNSLIIQILGEKWGNLLPVMKILVYSFAFSFVSSSISFIFIRTNRQKEMLFFDSFHVILVILSILLSYHFFHDFQNMLYAYVVANSFYYIFAITLAFYFSKRIR